MSTGVSRKTSGGRQARAKEGAKQAAPGWRVVGLLLGLAMTLAGAGATLYNGVNTVQATGLVGTRGTFTVDYCTDHDARSNRSDYTCDGDLVAHGDGAGDRVAGTLEDGGDYARGKKLGVADNLLGSPYHFRETGVGATLLGLLWLCLSLALLAMGYFTTRTWARSFRRTGART